MLSGLSGCAKQGRKSKTPDDTSWAKELDAELAKGPKDTASYRDAALLSSAFLADIAPAPRYEAYKTAGINDALGAYALGVRALRRHNPKELLFAAQSLLAMERKEGSQQDAPATAQVLDWLWQELQDEPGLHDEIEALWSSYKAAPLGRSSKRALQSLIGKSRRLSGKPYAFAHQAQGCIQSFSATPVQGTLGDLSLTRANLDGAWNKVAGEKALFFPLTCAIRVWNPTQDAGFVGLQSDITLDKAGMILNLATPATARVWLDGQEIWRNDGLGQFSARDVELKVDAAPGLHRLKVAVSIPGDKEWLLVRATDLQGNALAAKAAEQSPKASSAKLAVKDLRSEAKARCKAQLGSVKTRDPRLAEPWIAHCSLSAALDRHDRESSFLRVSEIERFDSFAEGIALLADNDLQNYELAPSLRKSSASQKLAGAVELDPSLLGLSIALSQSRASRGESEQVREELAAMKAPKHVDDALFRFGLYLDIGDELRADEMLKLAQSLAPEHCEVLAAAFRRARDLDARARQAELLPKLAHCPGYRTLALRFWAGRGRDDRAKPLLDALISDRPDDVDKLLRRAKLHQRQGHWALAKQDLDRILALQPASFPAHLLLADKAKSSEDARTAVALLEGLKDRYPNENYLYRYLHDLGVADPILRDRVKGERLVKDYEKEQSASSLFAEDASVFVLDRDVAHVYENGSQRHLIHQIIRVQSKEAIDAYGEITIPENAELLTLRTIKKDGRMIEPEKTPGKSSFSMRALELGDYVEQEFIMPAQWAQAQQGATDLGLFRFASPQAPFVRSELIVQAPQSLDLQIESRNNAPKPTMVDKDGVRQWSFVAKNQARVVLEPSTPSTQEFIPQVRCFAKLSSAQWLDELVATTMNARRRGPRLRDQVRTWTKNAKTPAQKLRSIYKQVNLSIEPKGDLGSDVNRTLSSAKGSRSNLLYAMLKEAKIPVRLLIARSRFAPTIDPQKGHPQFDSYETAVLEVWPDDAKRRRYLVPDLPFAPIGYLPEWLEGALAHVMPEPGKTAQGKPLQIQKGQASLADRRDLELEIQLDDKGHATVKGRLELYGFYATQWRQTLKQSSSENESELFSQYELPRFFPGKSPTLQALKIKNARNPQKPLLMEFELGVTQLATVTGKAFELTGNFVHLNPGAALVGLAQRKLDLLIASAGRSKAKISLSLPKGWTWQAGLKDTLERKLISRFGEFKQRPQIQGSRLLLETQSKLTPQIVSPLLYPKLRHFVHEIHRTQSQRIIARPGVQAR